MTIAKRVRDCRYAKGWGPDELASRAAISRTALYQIECGKTETPRAGTLRRIAEALGVSIESLMGSEDGHSLEPAKPVREEVPSQPAWKEAEFRHERFAPPTAFAAREQELLRMFRDLLHSPMGSGVAKLVEEAHRMLPSFQKSSAD